jgi:HEPN domain-containing protein
MHTNDGDITDNHINTYNTNVFMYPDQDMAEIKRWKERLISITEQVPAEADKIKPLIQFMVTTIAPAKIYMMKYPDVNTTVPDKYIDLLIVISSKNNTPFTELQPILDIAYLNGWRVSCSLHSEGNVIDGLRKGHIFYSLQCIPENLIYDDKVTTYPVTPPEILREMKSKAYIKFEQNFANALDFHEGAVYLHENSTSRLTGFMLHQAAELTYRGILQSLNGYDKKTHEIRVLRKYVRRCAPQLCPIFSDDLEEEKRILDILESAYSYSRYESDYEISEGDLNVLFEKIILLQDMAQKVVHTVLTPD